MTTFARSSLPTTFRTVVLATLLVAGLLTSRTEALILDQSMRAATAPGWVIGGAAYLTASTGVDPVNDGWLRLTEATGNQAGYGFYDNAFDISQGVVIQFDYATWGGDGADGYSVYLFDGSYDSATFSAGASGGSLGYAQKTVVPLDPGITGGYIGVGIDEYGNFSNPSEGRIGGPGQRANSVAVRGPYDHTSGAYYYLGGTAANVGTLWFNQAYRPPQTGLQYRKVIIYLTPALPATDMRIDVFMQFGYNQPLTQVITNLRTGQPIPTSVKIGYAASTGGANNVHEIRNLTIDNLPVDINLAMAKSASVPIVAPGGALTYTVTARNYGPNLVTVANNVPIVDTLPAEILAGVPAPTWTCVGTNGGFGIGVCDNLSGSGNLNTTADLPFNASVTYTISGTVAAGTPLGTLLTNTASLSAPAGITDYNPADNNASVDTVVSNGNITISGTVYNDSGVGVGGIAHNGVRDGTEAGVNAGLTYYAKLFRPTDLTATVVAPVTVNAATGVYTFAGVPGYGDYLVILSSNNTANLFSPSFPSANWIYVAPVNYTLTGIVANGANLTNQNFFVYNGSRISGKVIKDDGFNGSISTAYDGILNAAETGIAGVTVRLANNTGVTTYDTTVTDGNGAFILFTNTASATLRIYETNLPAYTSVSWNPGTTPTPTYTIGGEYIQFAYTLYADYNNILFGDIPPPVTIAFTPTPQSADGTPAAPVYYPHTFTSTARGSVAFAVASRTQGAWPAVGFVHDLDCNGSFDAGEPDITGAITLEANTDLCILVRETIPAGAVALASDVVTTRATFSYGLASLTADVVDTTTVLPYPILSTSTKSWVDLNGGDQEPGDVIRYTITLIESAGVAANGVQVTDDIPNDVDDLVAGNIVYPAGANNFSAYAGGGANGNGFLDIRDIAVPANDSVTISYTVAIAAGSPAGTVIDNSAAIFVPGGSGGTPNAPSLTVSSGSIPGSGNKPLYLYDGTSTPAYKLSRAPMVVNAGSFVAIPKNNGTVNGIQNWSLSPVLAANETIAAGNIPVQLWLGTNSNRTYTIPITLFCGATSVANLATGTAALTATATLFTFNLPRATPYTCNAGNAWTLRVENTMTGGGGARDVRVYPAPATGNYSNVTLAAQNVINVDDITFHTDAYINGGGSTVTSLAAGNQVWIQSGVSDPFGAYDITGATLILNDFTGTPRIGSPVPAAMNEVFAAGAVKIYEYGPYTIPLPGPGGAWTARVSATEGSEGTISDFALQALSVTVPLPSLTVLKSAGGVTKANSGDVLTYTITTSNGGSGVATAVNVLDNLSPFVALILDYDGVTPPYQPFDFTPASSGLTLGSPVYYDSGGVFTPNFAAGEDGSVIRWEIPMTGSFNAGGTFTVRFKVRVK